MYGDCTHIMVRLERMLDYRGVGLARYHCIAIIQPSFTSRCVGVYTYYLGVLSQVYICPPTYVRMYIAIIQPSFTSRCVGVYTYYLGVLSQVCTLSHMYHQTRIQVHKCMYLLIRVQVPQFRIQICLHMYAQFRIQVHLCMYPLIRDTSTPNIGYKYVPTYQWCGIC